VYVTDESTLLYVLEIGAPDAAVVEDVLTGNIVKMRASALREWRVVTPMESDG
jgi:hypothetical protein